MKVCIKCGKEKELDMFHVKWNACKTCRREMDRARYKRNKRFDIEKEEIGTKIRKYIAIFLIFIPMLFIIAKIFLVLV